jgi:hypothetical protein
MAMPTLADGRSDTKAVETDPVARGLRAAYARERLEEVIRALAEDALSPSHSDLLPWNDETLFEADLRAAVADVTDATTILLVRRLTDVMHSAPPKLAGRLAAAPRFSDQA